MSAGERARRMLALARAWKPRGPEPALAQALRSARNFEALSKILLDRIIVLEAEVVRLTPKRRRKAA